MRHIKINITLVLIYIAFSCNTEKEGSLLIINTQAERPSLQGLSKVFNKTESIKLETPDSVLIANVGSILRTRHFIFIAESKRVFQFDISGRFIRQIGRYGHGPGEHMSVFNIAVDTNNKRLIRVCQ